MNKLLIISDSHGLTDELTMISQRHKDINYMVHCGDSELNESSPYLKSYATVRGNCDWTGKFPNEIQFDIDDLSVYATHGHHYGVKYSLIDLIERAKEVNANIICSGHSHIAFAELHEGMLFINPGSIRLPRARNDKTYAIVSWKDREHVKVEFYDLDGRIINDISEQEKFSI